MLLTRIFLWDKLLLIVSVFILLMAFHALEVFGFPYSPQESFKIASKATVLGNDSLENIRIFHVVPESINQNDFSLHFFDEEGGLAVCTLTMSKHDNTTACHLTGEAIHERLFKQHILESRGMFIVPGFSVPCDTLPVQRLFDRDTHVQYEIKRSVGAQSFVDAYQVSSVCVSVEDAIHKKWIKSDRLNTSDLVLIKVVNLRTRQLVVQQLWQKTASWWIYEETPYRRSWCDY